MSEERYVTLEAVAECFQVELHWLEEVCELDLVPHVRRERALSVEAIQLERVARIIRLHFHLGIELSALEVLLSHPRP